MISGGGPVGMGLALELGRYGIQCTVIEKTPVIHRIPKGQNLTQRTLEHFRRWGIEKEIRRARVLPDTFGIVGVTTFGSLTSGYAYRWHQRELVRPYYSTDNERLPQYETERVLRSKIATIKSLDYRFGCEVESVDQDYSGVVVKVRHGNEGRVEQLTSDYLIGCDGTHSRVREQAGIELVEHDHEKRMVLLLFKSPKLTKVLEHYSGASYFNVLSAEQDGYWQFFGRIDLNHTYFFHMPVPSRAKLSDAELKAIVAQAAGTDVDAKIEYAGYWDLRFATAMSFRSKRIFIAGDAAHSHPPYGGYGINLGLEDARNLGWKLAGVLSGWLDPAILDTYTQERKPVFDSTADNFIARSISRDRSFVRNFDPARDKVAFEHEWEKRSNSTSDEIKSYSPNYGGSPIVYGPDGAESSALGLHSFEARPGHHLSPQSLSSGDNACDVLSDGFSLLAFGDVEDDVEQLLRSASMLNIPLKVIRDSLSNGREKYENPLIIVRPDQFVAWAGHRVDGNANEILQRLTGRSVQEIHLSRST